MSDGIGAARRRKMRCQKRTSLVMRRCSYTPATEPVLQSIHYARSGISRSGGATMRHYLIKIWNPREFFCKIIRPKTSIGPQGRASHLGFATWWIIHLRHCEFIWKMTYSHVKWCQSFKCDMILAHTQVHTFHIFFFHATKQDHVGLSTQSKSLFHMHKLALRNKQQCVHVVHIMRA